MLVGLSPSFIIPSLAASVFTVCSSSTLTMASSRGSIEQLLVLKILSLDPFGDSTSSSSRPFLFLLLLPDEYFLDDMSLKKNKQYTMTHIGGEAPEYGCRWPDPQVAVVNANKRTTS